MMETTRVVQKVVQRDHLGGRRQELVVGNLPRGEDYGLVSVELGGGRVRPGDAIQNADKVICGLVGKERGKGSVDASTQVGINSDDVSDKSEEGLACRVWRVQHAGQSRALLARAGAPPVVIMLALVDAPSAAPKRRPAHQDLGERYF
ncbi:hypothetical protein NDU88_009310 [Pleurodeles waltl]|uniref:Uncharacterized protein n=1 Tax=Pleurodeles waltl TaxID=8319 RepID=A0AAV7RXZ6_PLEWA|nr:hypothetical protein NDU88_009310 [Pleurodeles waltl]